MQTILVTGADGFIGSHLTEMLLEEGHHVRALSYYNSFNDWGWLEGLDHPELEVVTGDVRDPYFCKHLSKDVDTIFHLAALIAIPYSYIAPDSYVDTNIKGTLNICQAAKENGVKKVLITSTSETYGTAQYVPIDEKHPKQPQSPYSATKIAADAMAMSFYNTFELPVIVVCPFNTYGPMLPPAASLSVVAVARTAPVGSPGTPESKPITGMPAALALPSASSRDLGSQAASTIASGFWLMAAATCSTCWLTLLSASGPLVVRRTPRSAAAFSAPLKAAW